MSGKSKVRKPLAVFLLLLFLTVATPKRAMAQVCIDSWGWRAAGYAAVAMAGLAAAMAPPLIGFAVGMAFAVDSAFLINDFACR